MMRNSLLRIGFICILLFFISSALWAIGVEPLVLEFNAKPGDSIDFKLKLTPGEKPGNVKLSLYKIIQHLDGSLDYELAEPEKYPPAGWFTFPAKVRVNPGAATEINGKVKVPNDAKGTIKSVIMVEADTDRTQAGGVTLMYRYAVVANIRVERPGIWPSAEITGFDLTKTDKKLPLLTAQVKNTSPLEYPTYATATVRDSKKKLIQRVELRPDSYWNDPKAAGDPFILPNSQLLYTGKITEFLPPGQYEIRLFYRFGERGQLLRAKTVDIKDGEYAFPKEKMRSVQITPGELVFQGRPKGIVIKALKFENKSDKPVIIRMVPLDVTANYPFSIYKNTKVDLKGEPQFLLGARQVLMKIITVTFPKDAPVQGNYGAIKIQAFTSDEKPTLLEDNTLNLTAEIQGEKKRAFEVVGLQGECSGDNCVVSLIVKNTGNISISPKINLIVRNQEEKVVNGSNLVGEGEDEKITILPDRMATVTGTMMNIKPGKYIAQIKLLEGNQDIGTSELAFEIK